MNRLQQHTDAILHPVSIFDAPSVAELAAYLRQNYPTLFQAQGLPTTSPRVSPAQIEQARTYLAQRLSAPLRPSASPAKNKRAIFILSPPRAGSTLLRVILGGHPQLFSPPELYLLSFNTLQERREAFGQQLDFLSEGLERAIMALQTCSQAEAQTMLSVWEEAAMSTQALYRQLQDWLGERVLVDKTPSYAFNPAILQRMEAEFDQAHYIHLVRHPAATAVSFAESRIDLAIRTAQLATAVSPQQRGELWWLISQQNILAFLNQVPAKRQHRVHFEALVTEPEATVRALCQNLEIPFHPTMLQPYADTQQRMTDGVQPLARMIGDPKFHTYREITASVANRWQTIQPQDFLSEETWALAATLGYTKNNVETAAEEEHEVWEF